MEKVELGFAEECEEERLTNVYFPSKLGGKPAWLHLDELPGSAVLKCSKCNNQKSFLCQLYAPFDDEYNFHRMIYVFICRTEACNVANNNGNITILRSQLPLHNQFYPDLPPPEEGDYMAAVIPTKTELCLACGCPGPFKCSRCKKAFYCGTQHQRLHWPLHKAPCTSQEAFTERNSKPLAEIMFPEWEIDINSGDDDSESDLNSTNEMQKLEQSTFVNKGTLQDLPDAELEKYTHSEEVDDKFFEKFRQECEKDSLQIIRYARNGQVLWIADPEKTVNEQLKNIPKCGLCGESRAFEFQIMPQMLNYLKDSNIDWGIIAVFTCPKSCPLPKNKGYIEEFCIKQDILKN